LLSDSHFSEGFKEAKQTPQTKTKNPEGEEKTNI
jgi:hypothetical protein